jgi:hypothetical protein
MIRMVQVTVSLVSFIVLGVLLIEGAIITFLNADSLTFFFISALLGAITIYMAHRLDAFNAALKNRRSYKKNSFCSFRINTGGAR